jgi:hypothetical protein
MEKELVSELAAQPEEGKKKTPLSKEKKRHKQQKEKKNPIKKYNKQQQQQQEKQSMKDNQKHKFLSTKSSS